MGSLVSPGTTRTTAARRRQKKLAPVREVPPFQVEEVVRIKDVRRVQPRNHCELNDENSPPETRRDLCEHDDQESTYQLHTIMMRMVGIIVVEASPYNRTDGADFCATYAA